VSGSELGGILPYIIGYVIVELLGLPVDIFNLKMVKSENSIGIAQKPIALILNWVYMVINSLIIIFTHIKFRTHIIIVAKLTDIFLILFLLKIFPPRMVISHGFIPVDELSSSLVFTRPFESNYNASIILCIKSARLSTPVHPDECPTLHI